MAEEGEVLTVDVGDADRRAASPGACALADVPAVLNVHVPWRKWPSRALMRGSPDAVTVATDEHLHAGEQRDELLGGEGAVVVDDAAQVPRRPRVRGVEQGLQGGCLVRCLEHPPTRSAALPDSGRRWASDQCSGASRGLGRRHPFGHDGEVKTPVSRQVLLGVLAVAARRARVGRRPRHAGAVHARAGQRGGGQRHLHARPSGHRPRLGAARGSPSRHSRRRPATRWR